MVLDFILEGADALAEFLVDVLDELLVGFETGVDSGCC